MDRIPMAEPIGIGWRLESESGGGINRNRVAACAGIRNYRNTAFFLLKGKYFHDFKKITICVISDNLVIKTKSELR
jgi:hypothetical protein